ncbi:MAG: DUF2791 family P-loop domain-containing protein, partial [Verrucomicrobia bacterium]|nr:DUF2791 family P-loop domain-containing protein [Verrucomicrobiota bacterium]
MTLVITDRHGRAKQRIEFANSVALWSEVRRRLGWQLLWRDEAREFEEFVAAFCEAMNQPVPKESAAIRESFLQTARFVGREEELSQLTRALYRTLEGMGSLWLISGESGSGKTRLIEELRIQAMVQGALVLR